MKYYSRKNSIFAIYYMCKIMRRVDISFAALLIMLLMSLSATAQNAENHRMRSAAEDMLDRRRWSDARAILTELRTKLDPVSERYDVEWVDYHLVRCDVELGAPDAETLMYRYMSEYPSSVHTNQMQFLVGSYYCDEGHSDVAERELAKVEYRGLDAREKERYDIRVGYMRFCEGDYEAAADHFLRIATHSDYYPHALYYTSYIDYVSGRLDEAREGFTKLKTHDAYCDLVPYYLLQIEYRNANYDGVIEQGVALMSYAKGTVLEDLTRIVAESYFKKGDFSQTIRYISDYPESRMGRQEHYIKGYSLYRMARYNDAIEPLSKVCGADDALTQNASYHLADCYRRAGDNQHAADAFAIAAVEGFDDTIAENALLNYGRLKYELGGGLFNESINVLQSYLERYPSSEHTSEVKELLIAAYYNSKNYDAAYEAIKNFPNPDNDIRAALQKVATFRAVEAVSKGDLDSAEALLSEAEQINISPKYNALVLYWQGEVAYMRGDIKRALEKYQAYVRRAPKNESEYVMAHYGMGYGNFMTGNMKMAAADFECFVRDYTTRDDYMYDAHNRLGDARYSMRDFAKARRAYNIVASSSSEHRNYANYQLAVVDGLESKTKSKIERLSSIIAEDEGDYVDDAWYELGRTYINSEKYSDGANTLQEFINGNTSSPYYIKALSDLGLAYYNIGRTDDALKCYEEVVAYDPKSSEALEAMRNIREIYVAKGNVDDYFAYAERSGVQGDMSEAARDSLTFASAKNLYLAGDVEGATAKLKNYLDIFPKGYNRSEALFYVSDCYVQLADNMAAIESMSELLAQGTTQYSERVLSVLAPMTFEQRMYKRSAECYRQLYDIATKQSGRQTASEGYVEATMLYADSAGIKSMADDVLSMTDATPWALRQATLAKANVLREEGKADEAMKLYEQLAAERKTAEGAEAYYRLVETKFAAGDYAATEQMVYEFGESGSMYWQAKAFILLGDALVEMDNKFQARATYQSIVDGYSPNDDGIVDEALKRIKALK